MTSFLSTKSQRSDKQSKGKVLVIVDGVSAKTFPSIENVLNQTRFSISMIKWLSVEWVLHQDSNDT